MYYCQDCSRSFKDPGFENVYLIEGRLDKGLAETSYVEKCPHCGSQFFYWKEEMEIGTTKTASGVAIHATKGDGVMIRHHISTKIDRLYAHKMMIDAAIEIIDADGLDDVVELMAAGRKLTDEKIKELQA